MPGTLVRTSDGDVARELCAQVYFPHRLTVLHEPGQFAMSLSAARLGPVSVGLLGYSGEVRLETAELGTGYEVNVPLTGRLRTWTGQAEVCAAPGLAAVYRPDGRTVLQGWAGGGQLFGLKIERPAFEAELAELLGAPVRSVIRLGPSLDLSGGPGAQWWALARSLLALVRDPDGPLAQPMVARPLAHSVMTALLYVADHPYREALAAPARRAGSAAIQRAVDLLEAEPAEPWTAVDVARRAGLSVRALQDGFARHVGVSPMTYLRQVRLRRAHADLRAADPARRTVAGVAARWGFTHLGRFAAMYRQHYGVAPSQTLGDGS
jgi:AraC-like DNA-binding protein